MNLMSQLKKELEVYQADLDEARKAGDTSESALYSDALNKVQITRAKISDLENSEVEAEYVNEYNHVGVVLEGSHVVLRDVKTNELLELEITREVERYVPGTLTVGTPLYRCIRGKRQGDIIYTGFPGKEVYKIESLE